MLHQPTSPWRISTEIFLSKITLNNVLNNVHLITNRNYLESVRLDNCCLFFFFLVDTQIGMVTLHLVLGTKIALHEQYSPLYTLLISVLLINVVIFVCHPQKAYFFVGVRLCKSVASRECKALSEKIVFREPGIYT